MTLKKQILAICLAFALAATLLAGCSSGGQEQEQSQQSEEQPESSQAEQEPQPDADRTPVRVGSLLGPTGMGMVGVMDMQDQGTSVNDYTFTLAGAAEDMTAKILSGEVDIAAVPTNLASVLYNRTEGGVSVIAVNTLGVLYILDNGEGVQALEDLSGKTLYATGQAAAPEYILEYLLEQRGITDVDIQWRAEHTELATMMVAEQATLAMLPQPHVTNVITQNEHVQVALDLTAEWSATAPDTALVMGCLVVRNEFLEANREAVDAFLLEYEQSVHFVNRDIEDAAELMGKYEIIGAAVAEKAIPLCNIVFLSGDEMKGYVEDFLTVLMNANPQSVGGSLPDEAFYYMG